MDVAKGMTIIYGIVAVIATLFYIWLCTKWGKKWLKSLD